VPPSSELSFKTLIFINQHGQMSYKTHIFDIKILQKFRPCMYRLCTLSPIIPFNKYKRDYPKISQIIHFVF